jgi:hypothetical protein
VWQRGHFDVPAATTEERVAQRAHIYMQRVGDGLERLGFTVLAMQRPVPNDGTRLVLPDRRQYIIWAWCRRRPVVHHLEVPDSEVPLLEKLGMRLN